MQDDPFRQLGEKRNVSEWPVPDWKIRCAQPVVWRPLSRYGSLMAMVAITGITGLAGGRVANALRDFGHDVIGISRQPDLPSTDHVIRLVPDLTDASRLASAIAGCDAVFHFADRADRRAYNTANVGEAKSVMVALRMAAKRSQIDRLISISSVYADHKGGRTNLYGQSKRDMEAAALASEPGSPAVVLRLPPLYGPGARGAMRHITRAVEKCRIVPFGAAHNPRRFLSLDSLADLSVRLMNIDDATFLHAMGRIFVPVEVKRGSLASLSHFLGNGSTRLFPVPGIDKLIGGCVTAEQLERDRLELFEAVGWQANV